MKNQRNICIVEGKKVKEINKGLENIVGSYDNGNLTLFKKQGLFSKVKNSIKNAVLPYLTAGILALAPGAGGCGKNGGDAQPNNPPVLMPISDQFVQAEGYYFFDVNTNQGTDYDEDGDPVTYQILSGPPFIQMINPVMGIIYITPYQSHLGEHAVTLQCTDNRSNVSQPVTYKLIVHSPTSQVDLSNPSDKVNYAIITNNTLAPSFQTLADWKTRKGVVTKIYSIDDILADSTYASGRDDAEKLRFFLQDLKKSHPELEYVLLGGDVEIVPHRGAWGEILLGGRWLEDSNIPCDQYFGDLDNKTGNYDRSYDWDTDNDNLFGEFEDDPDCDMYYEIAVGRAPVNTTSEADNFVDKILLYEQAEISHAKDVLFMASMLDAVTDDAIAKDFIYTNIVDFSGYNLRRMYETQYNGGEPLDGDRAMSALNTGYNLVNIMGHGAKFFMQTGSNALSYLNILTLTNLDKLSIIYSVACSNCAFDNVEPGDSILEHFILNPNGGAVACIGSSRLTIYAIGEPLMGTSWQYDASFFDSLYLKGINNIGKALADSKERFITYSRSPPGLVARESRWCQFALNLLGCPEMRVWKNNNGILVPNASGNNYTQVIATSGGNPVSNARVCVVSGNNLYSSETNSEGKVVINIPYNPSNKITVTKQDYLPGLIN